MGCNNKSWEGDFSCRPFVISSHVNNLTSPSNTSQRRLALTICPHLTVLDTNCGTTRRPFVFAAFPQAQKTLSLSSPLLMHAPKIPLIPRKCNKRCKKKNISFDGLYKTHKREKITRAFVCVMLRLGQKLPRGKTEEIRGLLF